MRSAELIPRLKAKNEDLISSRIGYGQDAERRGGKLLAELKKLELEEPSLKSELLSRAGAVEETKQILETKKEDLKRSGQRLEDLKQQQLHGLSIDKAAADGATSRAGEARRHAENLESSLKGKQRSGNLGLKAAKKEAKDLGDLAQQKTADYTAKLKEYNQARRDSLFPYIFLQLHAADIFYVFPSRPLPSSPNDVIKRFSH